MSCRFFRVAYVLSVVVFLLLIDAYAFGQSVPIRDHDHYAAHWCLDKVQDCPSPATTMTSTYPHLLDWQLAHDPLLAYYADPTPLAKRGAQLHTPYQVLPMLMFSTSLTPAHMVTADPDPAALLTAWHYLSAVDYFGGSQSEGQVLAPSPGWIKAAHQNGVKILGSIFLSPIPFGGDKEQEAIDALFAPCGYGQLCKSYPEADKLIAIAKAYGFDGYFINEEARWLSSDLATAVANFIDYIHSKDASLRIDWYPGTTDVASDPEQIVLMHAGKVVSDDIFMDYGWSWDLDAALAGAKSIGYPAAKLDFGFDAEGGSYGALSDWNLLIDGQLQARGSIAEFGFQGVLCNGRCEQQTIENINTAERQFWIGNAPGVAQNFQALARDPEYSQRLSVTLPFVTYFNTGQGRHYFLNGQATGVGRWHDMAAQDLLPVLRTDTSWHYNYDNALWGGSSLDIVDSGNEQPLVLYDVALQHPIHASHAATAIFKVVYRYANAGLGRMAEVVLQDKTHQSVLTLPLPSTAAAGWHSISVPCGMDATQVAHISVQFVALDKKIPTPSAQTELMLGQIFLGAAPASVHAVKQVSISALGSEPDGLTAWWQLQWPNTQHDASKSVYEICEAGKFLGRTKQHVFALARQRGAAQPQDIQVMQVSPDIAGVTPCPAVAYH